jgi:hypothetical protein
VNWDRRRRDISFWTRDCQEIAMSKTLVLSVVFLVCAVMLGIARYDAHYADRIHHSQQVG